MSAWLLVALVAALASACGGSSDSEAWGPGTYEYSEDGVEYEIEIPAPPDHPLVLKAEEYRESLGASRSSYVIVRADASAPEVPTDADLGGYVEIAVDTDGGMAYFTCHVPWDWNPDPNSEMPGRETPVVPTLVDEYDELVEAVRLLWPPDRVSVSEGLCFDDQHTLGSVDRVRASSPDDGIGAEMVKAGDTGD